LRGTKEEVVGKKWSELGEKLLGEKLRARLERLQKSIIMAKNFIDF